MKSQDAGKFAEALVAIGEMYDKPVSNALARLYFDDLSEFDLELVLGAMRAHRKDPDRGRFFPKPADLISKMAPDAKRSASLAWVEVPTLLRNSRAAKSVDPVTERVVQDLGGWFALGQKTAAELVWVEKEFVQRYEMYAELGLDVKAISGPRQGMIGAAQALLKPPGG